jgi:hypothetical protein
MGVRIRAVVLLLVANALSCGSDPVVCSDERGVRVLGMPKVVRVGDEFTLRARLRSCDGEVVDDPVMWVPAGGPQLLSVGVKTGRVFAREPGQAGIQLRIGDGCEADEDRKCWYRNVFVDIRPR